MESIKVAVDPSPWRGVETIVFHHSGGDTVGCSLACSNPHARRKYGSAAVLADNAKPKRYKIRNPK
jgi:hypothetical protein